MGGKKQKPKPKYKPAKIRVKPSEPRLVVFISSLMGKMKGERDTAYRTIDSFPITRPWAFEYTSASSQNVDDAYLSKVRTCDIFLMILGKDYSEPVVLEYRTAIESRKPTLIFVTAGEKDEKQTEFIDSLPPKYAPYTDSETLGGLVYAAISDELTQGYRKYGALIPPSKVPQVIEHLPLTVPASKQMAGYLIVGLEDNEEEPAKELFELFGATPPPEDLKQLSQTLEPVYIKSLVEMKETIFAISNANARSRAASEDKRDKVFLRELKREVVELASQYAMRRKNNTREPDVAIPGVDYYILALDPNLARIYKLLEGVLREPVQIQRTPPELMFKNPDRFVKVLQIIQETTKNASEGEIMRRLTVEAALLDDEDDED